MGERGKSRDNTPVAIGRKERQAAGVIQSKKKTITPKKRKRDAGKGNGPITPQKKEPVERGESSRDKGKNYLLNGKKSPTEEAVTSKSAKLKEQNQKKQKPNRHSLEQKKRQKKPRTANLFRNSQKGKSGWVTVEGAC